MLRHALSRQNFRPRVLNRLRRVHDKAEAPTLQPPPSSFAARGEEEKHHHTHDGVSTPPLYVPPPPEPEVDLSNVPLDDRGLPSMEWIQRQTKSQIVRRAVENVPEYDETALRDFYKQVVLSGAPKVAEDLMMIGEPTTEPLSKSERLTLLSGLAHRLKRRPEGEAGAIALLPAIPEGTPEHVTLTAALLDLAPEDVAPSMPVPLGVVRKSEWQALFDSFIDRSDAQGAEVLLSTMQRHGTPPSIEQLDKVVELYAGRGQTTDIARLISDFEIAEIPITDKHRDLLISSYLHGSKPDSEGAIAILHASENMGKPFPQSSYNVVLKHLTEPTIVSQPDSHSRTLAWDLFAHMRLAAHSAPLRELYTTMIRVCGDSADPQPERARDLWIEMTTRGDIEPRREDYDAIIRALGSTKSDYLEAYDLLRQMLAKHHEATFVPFEEEDTSTRLSPWVPTIQTFTALLEGTKRAGDLERARWVLSEVVDLARAAAFTGTGSLKGPDEELMANVFMTYATWNAPVTRSSVKAEKKDAHEATVSKAEEGPSSVIESENQASETDSPRTSAEALREVELLFERVVHDARAAMSGSANIVHYPFSGVRLTPRLINSYLAVHLKHANNYADARAVYEHVWSAFSQLPGGPKPNGWTFLQVMDRCVRGRLAKEERATAFAWAEDTWAAYRKWFRTTSPTVKGDTPANRRKRWVLGLGERQTEKMWAHSIRLSAMQDDIPTGLKRLGEFVELYPPNDLLKTYSPKLRSPGFKISMIDPISVAEPHVPPHLLFRDLDVLHQRCVRDEHADGLRKIKFATTAYANCLGKRRKWRVQSVGVERELRKRQRHPNVLVRGGSLTNRIAEEGEAEEVEDEA